MQTSKMLQEADRRGYKGRVDINEEETQALCWTLDFSYGIWLDEDANVLGYVNSDSKDCSEPTLKEKMTYKKQKKARKNKAVAGVPIPAPDPEPEEEYYRTADPEPEPEPEPEPQPEPAPFDQQEDNAPDQAEDSAEGQPEDTENYSADPVY